MIPAAKSIATNGAATPALGSTTTEIPATTFDAILSLETLAATIASLDPAAAALEGEFIESSDSSDFDTDDTEDEEGEGALAFLADLLNVTAVAHPVNPGATPGEPAANDDVLSAPTRPVGESITKLTSTKDGDAPAADKLAGVGALQVAVEVAAAEVISTNAEGTRPVDDLAGVTRAADWTQPTRHVTTGAERHAIATHVRDPRWAEEFGTRIALLVRGGESSASLQLSPVELGPLDVSVTVRDSQASIHFGAAQAETRALIEASIPRLREMLETQGFQLANASVSTGSGQGHRQHVASGAQSPGESESPTTESGPMVSMNLLDVYV